MFHSSFALLTSLRSLTWTFAGMGHAHQGANPLSRRAHRHRRLRGVPGGGSASHHRQSRLDDSPLGLGHRQKHVHSYTPQGSETLTYAAKESVVFQKSVRSLVLHPSLFMFASGSTDNIKEWKCPNGDFIQNLS